MKKNVGFTLIELIIYLAIVSTVLTALIKYSWNTIELGEKSVTEQEVFANARLVSERIKYEIRNSTGINTVSSTSISLQESGGTDPTVISLSSGNIVITQGVGPTAGPLNSNDISITSLTFTNYTSSNNKTKHIGFSFTAQSTYSGARAEFKISPITIRSSAEVRSN